MVLSVSPVLRLPEKRELPALLLIGDSRTFERATNFVRRHFAFKRGHKSRVTKALGRGPDLRVCLAKEGLSATLVKTVLSKKFIKIVFKL